jgi:hypothetical protein
VKSLIFKSRAEIIMAELFLFDFANLPTGAVNQLSRLIGPIKANMMHATTASLRGLAWDPSELQPMIAVTWGDTSIGEILVDIVVRQPLGEPMVLVVARNYLCLTSTSLKKPETGSAIAWKNIDEELEQSIKLADERAAYTRPASNLYLQILNVFALSAANCTRGPVV